jgi:hypothetical protein
VGDYRPTLTIHQDPIPRVSVCVSAFTFACSSLISIDER